MIEAYKKMFANYANFSGRATRGEYWWVVLCQAIIYVIIYVIIFAAAVMGSDALIMTAYGLLLLYGLATILPRLALTVRRLYDTDKSGWFILMSFVPCLNIVLLVFTILDGTPGPNRFGEPSSL